MAAHVVSQERIQEIRAAYDPHDHFEKWGNAVVRDLLLALDAATEELKIATEAMDMQAKAHGYWKKWAGDYQVDRDVALARAAAAEQELSRLRAERTKYEQSVRPFLPGAGDGIWGRIKAFIVEGAPSRDEGIRLARDITRWQTRLPPGAPQE